ncbi:MAG: hypothetical protein KJ697_04260 [Nanoarchaeota archaeon]|nr:hypothetical protein [Nanoarchaeota archaeon]
MKIMTILITLVVVILLITIAVGIVKGFPTDAGGKESTLIQLCAVWKDEYKCDSIAYLNEDVSNLKILCEDFYGKIPDIDLNEEGVNKHCKKMCVENNCNPMIISSTGGGEMQ